MANLIVSNRCNATCSYCFANAYLTSTRKADASSFMSVEEFTATLEFLDRSGIDEARLLGGEPTLHPDFAALLQLADLHGKNITVFTHGIMSEMALESLLDLPVEKCRVIVNMSANFTGSPVSMHTAEKRRRILKALGPRALLGFNIQSPDFDLAPVIQTAVETGARKVIRLGMALPGPRSSNHFVHPKQYRLIGERIARQSEMAARDGICLDLDCGFVRCMFSDEELTLMKENGMQPGWHCNPILDICPGGEVLHCFSLSDRFSRSLTVEATASNLRAAFSSQVSGYRTAGVFRECSACAYKAAQECSGGCLSATLRRFQPAKIRLQMPQA